MNRQSIYNAVFARLQTMSGFNTISRRLKHWSDVSRAEQPAAFLSFKSEVGTGETGVPNKWLTEFDVYIYANTPEPDSPSDKLGELLDEVEKAINDTTNPITNVNTLGGLVEYCRIDGVIETDEGTLGDQAVAIVPIKILSS